MDLPGRQLTIAKDTVPAEISPAAPGETVHYRFTVTNTGNVAYLPATVVDALADAVDAAGLAHDGNRHRSRLGIGRCICKDPDVDRPAAAGRDATIDYDMLVTTPMSGDGWIENVVSSSDPGANCPTDLLNANGGLALAFGDMPAGCKSHADPLAADRQDLGPGQRCRSLAIGQVITYTVTITNTGQAVPSRRRRSPTI